MREPTYMVRPFPKYGRRKITENSIEVDDEIKQRTRKTEENGMEIISKSMNEKNQMKASSKIGSSGV